MGGSLEFYPGGVGGVGWESEYDTGTMCVDGLGVRQKGKL